MYMANACNDYVWKYSPFTLAAMADAAGASISSEDARRWFAKSEDVYRWFAKLEEKVYEMRLRHSMPFVRGRETFIGTIEFKDPDMTVRCIHCGHRYPATDEAFHSCFELKTKSSIS